MGVPPLSPEQRSVQFGFELLDRPRERGLRDMELAGGPREVEVPGNRKEIPDLMHLQTSKISRTLALTRKPPRRARGIVCVTSTPSPDGAP